MALAGGEETEVLPGPLAWSQWTLAGGGIYFMIDRGLVRWRRQEFVVSYLDLASGEVTEVFRKEGAFTHAWLSVSPDEEWILYDESPAWPAELMLVDGFR